MHRHKGIVNSKVLRSSKEGWIEISIDSHEYYYTLDAIFIPTFLYLHKRNKGKGIAFLKKKQRFYKKVK